MVLEARVGGVSLASNVFTVVTDPMISASQAIGIAHAAITNTVDLQAGAPITAVLSAKTYVVTFWLELPPDTLGPDYSAKVTIDAFTGAVLFILGRS